MPHQPHDRDTLTAVIDAIIIEHEKWLALTDTHGSLVAAGYSMGLQKAWDVVEAMKATIR